MSNPLWHEPAPPRVGPRIPCWLQFLAFAAAILLAIYFIDQPLARWARAHPVPDLGYSASSAKAIIPVETAPAPVPARGDAGRELMFLEQYGQGICSVVAVLLVASLDPQGRRRALAVALACLVTLALTHLAKDLIGRARPFVTAGDSWRGPWQSASSWGSFPSAHTTAAFALATALSWYYPRGKLLFLALALTTASLRILHTAHYLSDVIAGIALGTHAARLTLQGKLAGRLLALLPAAAQSWWQQAPGGIPGR